MAIETSVKQVTPVTVDDIKDKEINLIAEIDGKWVKMSVATLFDSIFKEDNI